VVTRSEWGMELQAYESVRHYIGSGILLLHKKLVNNNVVLKICLTAT
jgi:hypothetical protein